MHTYKACKFSEEKVVTDLENTTDQEARKAVEELKKNDKATNAQNLS